MKTTTCPKCLGARHFDTLRHVEQGVCFRCNGRGTVEIRTAVTVATPAPEAREAVEMLRMLYSAARSQDEGWFDTLDTAYDTAADVRFWVGLVDAAKRAQVLAAFEAIGAGADWMARVG